MIPTSCRTPEINSLVRNCIGCEKPKVTPGTCSKVFCIFSVNSSRVSALVQSFLGFNKMVISAASMGIGSVGISDAPILPITSFTSGYVFINRLDACSILSIVWSNELPTNNLVSTAKSPSSSVGRNSPPRELKITADNPRSVIATIKTVFLNRSAPLINGS